MERCPVIGTGTGIRTRVSAVRGRRPRPLDDTGKLWLGEEDSNLRNEIQSLVSYRWTIPQGGSSRARPIIAREDEARNPTVSRQRLTRPPSADA